MSEGRVYLNVEETAKYLKVSKGTLYSLVRKGLVPYHKFKQKILFTQEQIDMWIDRITSREMEEKITAEEKLLRRLGPFWDHLSPDTQEEINERIKIVEYWADELAWVVKRVEQTRGNCRFRESDCLLKKQTRPQGSEKRGQGTEAKQQSQPGPGSPQPSSQVHHRRTHIRRPDRPRRRPHELIQQRPATPVETPSKKDTEKGITPSTGSPEGEKPIGVEAPAKEEKPPQEVPESQETVPAEQPSSGPDLPSDQPGGDPVSRDQTDDPLDPNRNVKKGEEENANKETPNSK